MLFASGNSSTKVAPRPVFASHQIGAGIGALGAGVIRSTLTTYTPAWVVAGAICMIAAVIVLRIGRRGVAVPVVPEAVATPVGPA